MKDQTVQFTITRKGKLRVRTRKFNEPHKARIGMTQLPCTMSPKTARAIAQAYLADGGQL